MYAFGDRQRDADRLPVGERQGITHRKRHCLKLALGDAQRNRGHQRLEYALPIAERDRLAVFHCRLAHGEPESLSLPLAASR
jgi:hypothetical protein